MIIMYPNYRDKPKHFLNTLILLDDTMEYGKLFQIATAYEKKEEFVQVWGCKRVHKRMCMSGEVTCTMLKHQGAN